jgi:hypothetical protein
VLDAKGAALAAVVGELVLAATTVTMLVRARPALRPRAGRLLRAIAAAVLGGAAGALVLTIGDVAAAVVALAVYVAAAFALRAVPLELVHALARRNPAPG